MTTRHRAVALHHEEERGSLAVLLEMRAVGEMVDALWKNCMSEKKAEKRSITYRGQP